jgi:hypothetical protein
MREVCVVHWKEGEAPGLCAGLEAKGFKTQHHPGDAGRVLGALKANPPAAVIIDLSRSPAQGRDLGIALRIFAGTRLVPLLFVEGEEEKVAMVRELLPDATYTSWTHIGKALEGLLEHPPTDPVIPSSGLAGYSGTPLPKKLGIKEGFQVLLAQGPEGFSEVLGPLPEGVCLVKRYGPRVDLILWFAKTEREVEAGIEKWASRVGKAGMWILWAKKGSPAHSGLTQAAVRRIGLANGLVDYKIAAVDSTWSGLKFARRRKGSV